MSWVRGGLLFIGLLWSSHLWASETFKNSAAMQCVRKALDAPCKQCSVAVAVFFNQYNGAVTSLGELLTSQVEASLGRAYKPRLDIKPVMMDVDKFDQVATNEALWQTNNTDIIIIGKYFIVGDQLKLFINPVSKMQQLQASSCSYETPFLQDWIPLEAKRRDTSSQIVVGNTTRAAAITLGLNRLCYRNNSEMIIHLTAPAGRYVYLLGFTEDGTAYRYYPSQSLGSNPLMTSTALEVPSSADRANKLTLTQNLLPGKLWSNEKVVVFVSETRLEVSFIPEFPVVAAGEEQKPWNYKQGAGMTQLKSLYDTQGIQVQSLDYIVSDHCPRN